MRDSTASAGISDERRSRISQSPHNYYYYRTRASTWTRGVTLGRGQRGSDAAFGVSFCSVSGSLMVRARKQASERAKGACSRATINQKPRKYLALKVRGTRPRRRWYARSCMSNAHKYAARGVKAPGYTRVHAWARGVRTLRACAYVRLHDRIVEDTHKHMQIYYTCSSAAK